MVKLPTDLGKNGSGGGIETCFISVIHALVGVDEKLQFIAILSL